MKKTLKYFTIFMCSAILAVSCGKEENTPTAPATDAKELNGNYDSQKQMNTLVLNYSGQPMLGKKADFNAIDNNHGTITLLNIIPGEAETVIDVELTENEEGFDIAMPSNKTNENLSVSGNIVAGTLSLDVNATLDNIYANTEWDLLPVVWDDWGMNMTQKPLSYDWISSKQVSIEIIPGFSTEKPMNDVITLMTAVVKIGDKDIYQALLDQVRKVTFRADGNVILEIQDTTETNDVIYVNTPDNVAMYYMKDDKFYLTINIAGAEANLPENDNKVETPADPNAPKPNLDPIMETLMPLLPQLEEGIEFGITTDPTAAENMNLFLGTELLKPIVQNALVPFVNDPKNIEFIEYMIDQDPNFAAQKATALSLCAQLEDVVKGTSKLEIGLNLTKHLN